MCIYSSAYVYVDIDISRVLSVCNKCTPFHRTGTAPMSRHLLNERSVFHRSVATVDTAGMGRGTHGRGRWRQLQLGSGPLDPDEMDNDLPQRTGLTISSKLFGKRN